ncbi:hypothetical protein D3C75_962730 [compost metagenome]
MYGLAIGVGVVLEHPGDHETCVGARAEHLGDAGRHLALPVRAHQQVEARFCVIHLAEFGETVGAQVHHLIHPEAAAEIRHLQHHRLEVQGDAASAVHHVLVRAGHQPFGRIYVVTEQG